MPETPELIFEQFPSHELNCFIEDNVATFTMALTEALDYQPVNYFLRQPRGEWVGGCLGLVWAGYLHVKWLWVAGSLRGKGYGAQLLRASEAMAISHGATASTLETLNPAAKSFYLGLGYEVFGVLEDFPPGHTKYYLKKSLVQAAPAKRAR